MQFFRYEVTFLGFIISREGVSPDPDKLQYMRELEEPKNKRHLQQI